MRPQRKDDLLAYALEANRWLGVGNWLAIPLDAAPEFEGLSRPALMLGCLMLARNPRRRMIRKANSSDLAELVSGRRPEGYMEGRRAIQQLHDAYDELHRSGTIHYPSFARGPRLAGEVADDS